MATDRQHLLDLARRWDAEADSLERALDCVGTDHEPSERHLLAMHARIKRACAYDLREQLHVVRRG